jgi:hypothetical protein
MLPPGKSNEIQPFKGPSAVKDMINIISQKRIIFEITSLYNGPGHIESNFENP